MDLNELEVGSFASQLQLKIDKQLKKEKNPEIPETVIFQKGKDKPVKPKKKQTKRILMRRRPMLYRKSNY